MSKVFELIRSTIIQNGISHPATFLTVHEENALCAAVNIACQKIAAGEFNVNEKDAEGNTVLHLLLSVKLTTPYHRRSRSPGPIDLLEALLKNGGDIDCKNADNKTPLDLYGESNCHIVAPEYLLSILTKCYLNNTNHDRFIISVLNVMAKTYRVMPQYFIEKFDSFLYFNKDKLCLDTLKSISIWFSNIKKSKLDDAQVEKWNVTNYKERVEKCKKTLDGEIQLLEQAWDLPKLLKCILHSKGETRDIFMRAMLLGGETPSISLLKELSKVSVFNALDGQLTHADFMRFINEYNAHCDVLERLKAQPTPLSKDELKLIKPICDQLNTMVYHLNIDRNLDKKWRERIANYGGTSPQKEMQERYAQYKAQDHLTRGTLFKEYAKYQAGIASDCMVEGSCLVTGLRKAK